MLPIITFYAVNTLFIALTVGFLLHKYFTKNFDYWKKRNVPYVKPLPLIGNLLDVFACRLSIGRLLVQRYSEFNTPYFGMYFLNKPSLIIRSPELIKSILSKDFNYFHNRTLFADNTFDPVGTHQLFIEKNPAWKFMRTKISPAFSTGKIKNMVGLINEIGEDMVLYVERNTQKDSIGIDAKDVFLKYSAELVATCAFGITANCFEREDAQFTVIGRKMFEYHWKATIRQVSYFLAPNLVKLFKMPFLDPSVTDFIREFVWKSIEDRERTKVVRNDIIDTLIKIRRESSPTDEFKFEGDRVVAQAGQFYIAGFETVSSTMAFALYELALQPKIQTKLRSEIKTVLSQHGFTYEALQEMTYLKMVMQETLRKYPILPFLDRTCEEDYKIPDADLVIEKGTPVYIPIMGLHYDPEYFPEPERFDPERFSEQNKDNLSGFAYLPFGAGPRNCLGQRLGVTAAKLGLVHVLSKFEVERTDNTPEPIDFEGRGFLLASTADIILRFKKGEIV